MKKHGVVSSTLNVCLFIFLIKDSVCLDPSYNLCIPKDCGDGLNISYPFIIKNLHDPVCGYPGFELECNSNGSAVFQMSENEYLVKSIDYERKSVRLVINTPSSYMTCPSSLKNFTIDFWFGINNGSTTNLVFLENCSRSQMLVNLTRYKIESCDQLVMLEDDVNMVFGKEVCTHEVVAPVEVPDSHTVVDGGNYREVMERGFTLTWFATECGECSRSGGRCGFNATIFLLICFCSDEPHRVSCPSIGNIKLRTSHREYSSGQQYYSCPLSKPRKDNGCGYFMWKDAFDEYLRTISAPTECSSCHEKDLRISLLETQKHVLETRIRVLEAKLEMATIPDDHACQSDALLHELLGDMDNLRM